MNRFARSLAALLVVIAFAPTFAHAQAPGAIPVPRTSDGKPDLSGVWVGGGFALLFGEAELDAIRKYDAALGRRPLPAPEPPPYKPEAEAKRQQYLARRGIDDPTDLAYYFCYSNKPTSLEELVHVAASRWTVEECFQTGKNEAGLDHYQVRDYTAWYKHMTLAMIALAFLTIIKTAEEKRGSSIRTTTSSH